MFSPQAAHLSASGHGQSPAESQQQRALSGRTGAHRYQPALSNHRLVAGNTRGLLQRKLAIGAPNDHFEQEANHVAAQVMSGATHASGAQTSLTRAGAAGSGLQRRCACGGKIGPDGECEECKKKRLQRKSRSSAGAASSNASAPPIVHQVLNSPGRPLDATTRAFMEPRFGYNFSQVRVHDDARAGASARSVNAVAYTVGHNVVFDSSASSAGYPSHQHVLAHELAHVVQQGGQSPGAGLTVAPSTDSAEGAADSAARNVLSGTQAAPGSAPARLQRLGGNPGCTAGQTTAIHQAIFNANSWVGKALTALAASPLTARTRSALTHNFGAGGIAAAAAIATNLRAGRADLLANPFSCANAAGDAFCANGNCGDSVPGSHASNICANVTLATADAVFRAGCVLHEAMHASDATMTADDYSGWFGHSGATAGYPGATPMTNADSYTTLCMELS